MHSSPAGVTQLCHNSCTPILRRQQQYKANRICVDTQGNCLQYLTWPARSGDADESGRLTGHEKHQVASRERPIYRCCLQCIISFELGILLLVCVCVILTEFTFTATAAAAARTKWVRPLRWIVYTMTVNRIPPASITVLITPRATPTGLSVHRVRTISTHATLKLTTHQSCRRTASSRACLIQHLAGLPC